MHLRHLSAMAALAATLCSAPLALGADHLDAPNLRMVGTGGDQPGDTDLNDLYAFQSPANPNNSVLIMTINPFSGLTNPFGTTSPTRFGADVTYNFNIDNDGDAVADIVYSATFGPTAFPGGTQPVSVTKSGMVGPYAAGATGAPVATTGGGALQAGQFEDPFFFDFFGFLEFTDPGSPNFGNPAAFDNGDTFAGADVSAIVLEIPSVELNGASSNIGVWATTEQGGSQVDRVGRPGINTVLIPSGMKQDFNEDAPMGDPAEYADDIQATLEGAPFSRSTADAMSLAGLLTPDILTFDTASAAGFGSDINAPLNGRRLEDDVIDAAFEVLANAPGLGDNVDANDAAFLNVFPYLAAANTAIPEPTSMALLLASAGGLLGVRRKRR